MIDNECAGCGRETSSTSGGGFCVDCEMGAMEDHLELAAELMTMPYEEADSDAP